MITGKAPLWISSQDSGIFVAQVCQQLEAGGYAVVRSFDLQKGLPSQGTNLSSEDAQPGCACGMVIFLVYGQSGPPVSLTFLNSGKETSLYINDGPSSGASACNCASIANLLSSSPESYGSINS